MSKKLYWGLGLLIVLFFGGLVLYTQYDLVKFYERIGKDNTTSEKRKTETEQPEGHDHTNGTFHEGTHADPIPGAEVPEEPKVQYTAPKGAVLTPEFPEIDPKAEPVKAAYNRLEYIKNNPYAWGGVHSPRATELIDQLMTESGPVRLIDHNHGDEVSEQIAELCKQGDPRAAGVLIAHMSDGDISWTLMDDALVAIGPPAVPYILTYLEKGMKEEGRDILISWEIFDSLTRIGVRYRDDLGGILNHIIIPKFKAIAADEDNKRYYHVTVMDACEALKKLQ